MDLIEKRILFVCLGNICRSPMAEFVFRDLVQKRGLGEQYEVASAATSAEEIGNGVHYGTRDKLREHGISTVGKRAVRLERGDYQKYDLLVGMETRNLTDMRRITGETRRGRYIGSWTSPRGPVTLQTLGTPETLTSRMTMFWRAVRPC